MGALKLRKEVSKPGLLQAVRAVFDPVRLPVGSLPLEHGGLKARSGKSTEILGSIFSPSRRWVLVKTSSRNRWVIGFIFYNALTVRVAAKRYPMRSIISIKNSLIRACLH